MRQDEPNAWRSELLLSHLAPPTREAAASLDDLESVLESQLEAGRSAWPDVSLPPEQYLRHVANLLSGGDADPTEPQLRGLPAADLYLAAACMLGDDTAIRAFHAAVLPALRKSLIKLGASPLMIDETEQRVLELLFVASPGIASYSGRGQLRSWVRSIGVRTCRRMMGSEPVGSTQDELDRLPGTATDPELALLKKRYRAEFSEAFGKALAALTGRERNLLRQHHIDGLTVDQLSGLYHVHRATAARWVARARRALMDGTRERLVAVLGVGSTELDSIIRLVRSQLEISIHETMQ